MINAKAVDKSEAMSKIKAVHQGEGLWAYVRSHQWFSKTTDQGKNNRRMLVMNPEPCKYDHEIAAAVEEWEERYRILKEEDKESELSESWRMTSLKRLLCGDIKIHVELQEDFKSYEELRTTIMRWATNKTLEKDRQKSDPMDCNNVNKGESGDTSNPEGKA